MEKSITVKKLISELKKLNPDTEIFIANKEKACFDGLNTVSKMVSVNGDEYIILIGGGDILAI